MEWNAGSFFERYEGMKNFVLSLLAVSLFAMVPEPAEAQLLRRRIASQHPTLNMQQCGPNGCPQVQVIIPQGPQQNTVSTTTAEVAAVMADIPNVRCIAGNSCGSGTICGSDGDGSFIVTNAHVAGTALGRSVNVDCVVNGSAQRVVGKTVMAGYSDSRMVDFCILYVEGLSSKRYMPMLKTEPDNPPFGTTGSPRCVWPLQTKSFGDARNYGDGLITGLPNAIGGQSGSAIYNSKQQQIALLTWSIGTRCAGQKTSKLWQVATSRNVLLADPRPVGLVELGECTGERPETKEGVFGECGLFEMQSGDRPFTANTIANIVGASMDQMPIWVTDGGPIEPEPDPNPDCPPCPTCPDCGDGGDGDCVVLDATEKALIDSIRAHKASVGDEKAFDFARLLAAILEIIKIIQEGRAG
jgi:hypothetical protein